MADERRVQVTTLLGRMAQGEDVKNELVELVYAELKTMAAGFMRHERPDHTWQPTVLAHDVFMKLVGTDQSFENRKHFYGSAAIAMKRLLIDHARRVRTEKDGGKLARVTLDLSDAGSSNVAIDLVDLADGLEALAAHSPTKATNIQLWMVNVSLRDRATFMEMGVSRVKREWEEAITFLAGALS